MIVYQQWKAFVYLEVGGGSPRAVTSCADNRTLVDVASGHQADSMSISKFVRVGYMRRIRRRGRRQRVKVSDELGESVT